MAETWWAEHGYQLFAGLWMLTSGVVVMLWWFIKKDRTTVDKELCRLDTTMDGLGRQVQDLKLESITRSDSILAKVGQLEISIVNQLADLKVSRAENFVTKKEFVEAIDELKEMLRSRRTK